MRVGHPDLGVRSSAEQRRPGESRPGGLIILTQYIQKRVARDQRVPTIHFTPLCKLRHIHIIIVRYFHLPRAHISSAPFVTAWGPTGDPFIGAARTSIKFQHAAPPPPISVNILPSL